MCRYSLVPMSVCLYFVDEILMFHNVVRKISMNIDNYRKFNQLSKKLNIV